MKSVAVWLVVVGAIGWAVAPGALGNPAGSQTPQTTPVEAGNAANGKALFMAHQCWACHGYNGETGTRFLREDGTFIPRLQTQSSFISFIRAPRPNEAPPIGSSVTMPSYGAASLPDQQAADLWAYIRTFKSTQPPLKDIPLLEQMLKEGGRLRNQP